MILNLKLLQIKMNRLHKSHLLQVNAYTLKKLRQFIAFSERMKN